MPENFSKKIVEGKQKQMFSWKRKKTSVVFTGQMG